MLKKVLSILLAAAMLLALVAPALAADTVDENSNTGIDIVMVIDRSGTMKDTDPHGIALSATRALADISRESNLAGRGGVSIALVTYGYDVINSTPFYNVSNPMEFQAFSDEVNSSGVPNSMEDTNTGRALEEAYELIREHREENPQHTFAVILLSDGKVQIGDSDGFFAEHGDELNVSVSNRKNSPEWQALTRQLVEESVEKGSEIAAKMQSEGIPLYCIGIYANGDRTTLGDDMRRWAGDGNYNETENISEVQQLMDNLYLRINETADLQPATLRPGGSVDFDVRASAIQVNIRVIPMVDEANWDKIHIMKLENGIETGYSGQPNKENFGGLAADGTSEGSYTIIRMIQPAAGTYRLRIEDGANYNYELAIISLYDLSLTLDNIASISNGTSTPISVRVTKYGNPYHNPGINPMLYVKGPFRDIQSAGDYDPNGLPMTWNENEQNYSVNFTPRGAGNYIVQARMMTTAAENMSEEQMLQVGLAEVRVNEGARIEHSFTGHAIQAHTASGLEEPYEQWTFTLDDLVGGNYLNNPDHVAIDQMEIVFENNDDDLAVNQNGSEINLWPQSAGGMTPGSKTVNFTLNVSVAGSNEPLTIPGSVTIEDLQDGVTRNSTAQVPTIELSGILFGDRTIEQEAIANVNDLFMEPNEDDGETFDVSVLSVEKEEDGNRTPTDKVEANIEDSTLKIIGKAAVKSAVVTLRAKSTDGSTIDFEIQVSVVNLLTRYLMIAGAALAVLLLIVIIIVAVHNANKPAFRRGSTLTIELTTENGTSMGVVSLSRYGKKAVKLSVLCAAGHVSTGKLRTNLEKVLILPRKKSGLVIRRGNKESILLNMDVHTIEFDADRMIELSYSED